MPRPSGALHVNKTFKNKSLIIEKGVGGKNRSYICMCLKCGHVYFSTLGNLKSKHSAGCVRCSVRSAPRVGDFINEFEIIGTVEKSLKNKLYVVRCPVCGEPFTGTLGELQNRKSNHCGCNGSFTGTHRMSTSHEYGCWKNMKARVLNPNTPSYEHYVEKNKLTLDSRWLLFKNFYKDMGPAPSDKHSIDRLDNTQGYFPTNCAWRLPSEQMRNTSNNVWCLYEGQKYCLKDLCTKLGIRYNTVVTRRNRGHANPFKLSGINDVTFLVDL